jgi:hypothetical protein
VGPRQIAHELARTAAEGSTPPGKSTVHRILRRHGLIEPGRRKRRDYRRWQRETPWRYGKSTCVHSSTCEGPQFHGYSLVNSTNRRTSRSRGAIVPSGRTRARIKPMRRWRPGSGLALVDLSVVEQRYRAW